MIYLVIKDLKTFPSLTTKTINGGGWKSVEEMQEELIRRAGNHWLNKDPRYCNFSVYDKIKNGVISWRFSDAKGRWEQSQQITLEEM